MSQLFRDHLVQSGLIDDAAVDDILRAWPGGEPDKVALADYLVHAGLITSWQAERLLQGKWKGFFVRQYRLEALLGMGTTGIVYRTRDLQSGRDAALKVLPRPPIDRSKQLAWLERQRGLLAIEHPNLVHVMETWRDEAGRCFIARQFVRGQSLLEVRSRHPDGLDQTAVSQIAAQLVAAVEHVHGRGHVLANLTPTDVLVDDDGRLKILMPGLSWPKYGRSLMAQYAFCDRQPTEAAETLRDAALSDDWFGVGCILLALCQPDDEPLPKHSDSISLWFSRHRADIPRSVAELTERLLGEAAG